MGAAGRAGPDTLAVAQGNQSLGRRLGRGIALGGGRAQKKDEAARVAISEVRTGFEPAYDGFAGDSRGSEVPPSARLAWGAGWRQVSPLGMSWSPVPDRCGNRFTPAGWLGTLVRAPRSHAQRPRPTAEHTKALPIRREPLPSA
jgi:hypothetical protein